MAEAGTAPPRAAINATIRRATFAAHRAMEHLDAEGLAELERLYRQAADDLAARIRAHAGADGNVALSELRSALAQVEVRLTDLAAARNATLDGGLARATRLGVTPWQPVLAPEAGMRVADEAVRFVRAFVAEDGLQLSDRLWRLDRGARDVVVNAIEQAVIQGHSASQAAREFLARGRAVPVDTQQKIGAANAARIAQDTTTQLLTGVGNPLDNAMRLFRTEVNRAHGEAYMAGGEDHPDFAGWRFLLSPAHPEPDICDLLSSQNIHGLGPGVYPDRARCPWPAHPNTLSFVVIVFKDEITQADRDGQETPIEALKRLTPAQLLGVLGKGKKEIFDRGALTQGMIRTPLRSVQARIGVPLTRTPAPPRPTVAPARPVTLDEMLAAGAQRAGEILARVREGEGTIEERFAQRLIFEVKRDRPTGHPAVLASIGRGSDLVRAASLLFPDDWTRAVDRVGPLTARFQDARASYRHEPSGAGHILARDFGSAVHEYTHRLQHGLHRLDDYFQDLHHRRTQGDPLRALRDLFPRHGYASYERAREDQYVTAYQGKVYDAGGYLGKHGALEVMTMAFEAALGGRQALLRGMLQFDREMINLVVGVLFNYVP